MKCRGTSNRKHSLVKGEKMKGKTISICLLTGCATLLFAAEDNSGYNMPVLTEKIQMKEDSVMKAMETAVSPDIWDAYKKAHVAPFWIFGEDRQLAVRNQILPAHWFSDIKKYQSFKGQAQPGEFYPFQACVASDMARDLIWDARVNSTAGLVYITPKTCKVQTKGVKPLWLMVKVPQNAKQGSVISGMVNVKDQKSGERVSLPFAITVKGNVLKDGGIHDAWRLARLSWLESSYGDGDQPTRFFTPIQVDKNKRSIHLIGRTLELSKNGLPTQYISTYNGSNTRTDAKPQNFLATPFDFALNGKQTKWRNESFAFGKATPAEVTWKACSRADGIRRTIQGKIGFDGFVSIQMSLQAVDAPCKISQAELTFSTPKGRSLYGMGLNKRGGKISDQLDWKWNVKNQQDAYWFGSVNQGMMFRLKGGNFSRALINAYYDFKPLNLPDSWGNGGVQMTCKNGAAAFRIYSKERTITQKPLVYGIDLYLTPFHPVHLKEHLADRYFHYGQHSGNPDFKGKAKEGATVINMHHNTIWNPYINYPYNDDGGPLLKKAVQEGHDLGLRMKVYYTTRELTQNMPEFFALKSLDGEIFMPRKEGIRWPVTNRNGPHPWLQQHVGMDIVPAWRENVRFNAYPNRLDLAVITTPDTRWNNFFLGGLEYLVKEFGIDGIYIDDTMLNRDAILRSRRILDADGNLERRMDIHSWSHFNGLAGRGNSAIIFMELLPFVDRMWYGEGFNYSNVTPDFWLIEMSGIPFGVMGEMLGGGVNLYRGMVFAETGRWGWGADPRNEWKFFDSVNLGDAEYIGYWDPENPVQLTPGSPVRATVYRLKDKSVISLGNFANQSVTVQLKLDAKALHLSEGKTTLRQPEVKGFQGEGTVDINQPLTLTCGNGRLLIAE